VLNSWRGMPVALAHQRTGGSDVLLVAIAAAVIGGVSLFGGRGSTYGALLGIAVIGSINNGMDLLELDSSTRFMIMAAVLLVAVIINSLSRRGRQLPGPPRSISTWRVLHVRKLADEDP
jgi:D-xylose transport system permease protein